MRVDLQIMLNGYGNNCYLLTVDEEEEKEDTNQEVIHKIN